MIIRKLREGDVTRLIQLMTQFAIYDDSLAELDIDKKRLTGAYFDTSVNFHGLVAEREGEIIGFLNYYYTYSSFSLQPCLWVEDVFIDQASRGLGAGNKMFHQIREIARAGNCVRIAWLVRKDNDIGRRFYEQLGAKIDEGTIHVKWEV